MFRVSIFISCLESNMITRCLMLIHIIHLDHLRPSLDYILTDEKSVRLDKRHKTCTTFDLYNPCRLRMTFSCLTQHRLKWC